MVLYELLYAAVTTFNGLFGGRSFRYRAPPPAPEPINAPQLPEPDCELLDESFAALSLADPSFSPLPLLDIPDGPLRLILSKLPLRDRLAASHTCRHLRRLITQDPDPGFLGRLVINISASRGSGPTAEPLFSVYDTAGFPPTIVVRLCAADSPEDRAAASDWLVQRIRGFSSCVVRVSAYAEDGVPGAAVLPLLADVASQIGALPRCPPLTISYAFYPTRDEAGQPFLGPFLDVLERFSAPPNKLRISLACCDFELESEADAFLRLAALSHIPCIQLTNFASNDSVSTEAVAICLARLAPLTSLQLGLGMYREGSEFADILMTLTGLRSLDMSLAATCEFPAGFADALSNVTHLGLRYQAGGQEDSPWSESLSDFADRFKSVTSVSFNSAHASLDAAGLKHFSINRLPVNVSALAIEIVAWTVRADPRESHNFTVDLSSDALSDILAASCLTSLEVRFVSEATFRSVSLWLGESFGRLTGLKSLRVLQTDGRHRFDNYASDPHIYLSLPSSFTGLTGLTALRLEGLINDSVPHIPAHIRETRRVRYDGSGSPSMRVRRERIRFSSAEDEPGTHPSGINWRNAAMVSVVEY